jgi:hypothetical protein
MSHEPFLATRKLLLCQLKNSVNHASTATKIKLLRKMFQCNRLSPHPALMHKKNYVSMKTKQNKKEKAKSNDKLFRKNQSQKFFQIDVRSCAKEDRNLS